MGDPNSRTKAPTIQDVARSAGVSVATAGRVLGGYGQVGEATAALVRAASEELGYRPNTLARSLITGRTQTLGVVLADIGNPFFAEVMRGITDGAQAAGLDVLLMNTDEDYDTEVQAVHVMSTKQVDGLIISPASGRRFGHLERLRDQGTPLVLVDRRPRGFRVDTVTVDNKPSARSVVNDLIQQGHHRIAYISGMDPENAAIGRQGLISSGTERVAGYREAMQHAGLESAIDVSYTGGRAERLADDVDRLLSRAPATTAVFCADSTIALLAIECLREREVAVPRDVSVVAFDNPRWAAALTPPLSVVEQPTTEIGTEAVQLILRRIQDPTAEFRHRVLRTSFVTRGSVRRLTERAIIELRDAESQ